MWPTLSGKRKSKNNGSLVINPTVIIKRFWFLIRFDHSFNKTEKVNTNTENWKSKPTEMSLPLRLLTNTNSFKAKTPTIIPSIIE